MKRGKTRCNLQVQHASMLALIGTVCIVRRQLSWGCINKSTIERIHFLRIYIIYLYVFVCFTSHHKLVFFFSLITNLFFVFPSFVNYVQSLWDETQQLYNVLNCQSILLFLSFLKLSEGSRITQRDIERGRGVERDGRSSRINLKWDFFILFF